MLSAPAVSSAIAPLGRGTRPAQAALMSIAKFSAWAVILLVLTSCGGGPTEPRDYEFGRADVYVRDAAGQPINGAAVRLERLNGGIEEAGGLTGSAGAPGYYFFLKTSGEYRVVITPPTGYTFATGQESSARVVFSPDQVRTVNFVLRPI